MEKREPYYTVGGNVNWYNHSGHVSGQNFHWKGTHCTHMLIASLFTIAKTPKQSKCPSTDKWIKKMWYIYTTEYYSAIKNINVFCSNMGGPRDSHTKWSKSERKRQISYDIIYLWNLKYGTGDPVDKTENRSWPRRADLWFPVGRDSDIPALVGSEQPRLLMVGKEAL